MANSKQLQRAGRRAGRPRKDIGGNQRALEAIQEVENRKAAGETYSKARAEVSETYGTDTRTLSRDKNLAASLDIMVNQPMALWRSLGHVLAGNNPFRKPPKKFNLDAHILSAVKAIFDTNKATKISTDDLVVALIAGGAPWDSCNGGNPISNHQLGYKLSKFGILSRKIRVPSGTTNGYHLNQFYDAFARYLPISATITSGTFSLE